MKNSMWSLKLSTSALVLIPAAVGINYIGKLFAGLLKLPLWLDAIGTVLAAMLAGPVVGAICGAINNIIYGLTMDPISFIYALTSIGIGLAVGVMAHKGRIKNIGSTIVVGLVAAVVATVISTPINIAFWGGQTGNVWGDLVYASMVAHHFPVWMASAVDEFIVDVPDKIATVMVAYGIFKGLPQKLTILFRHDSQTEKL
ncbi:MULTISPECIES: ECF transporter S component [unclassified Paludibacterium]|uniref:ECF transporter S component n=1 Tax=unclassified Paludibacterium TaxID=2618429 RepID=UPI001C03FB7F|nr:ECF transporter S component [Paludibacterium sp. B53371]BEV73018.1 ECF transporter S component [Paludibacterium sp. THUN1379]